MAKIQEEIIVLKFSKLVKNDQAGSPMLADRAATLSTLEQVAQELVGADIIVEAETVTEQ